MVNSSKCKKKQHDLAHSSSEVQAKLNFSVLLKVKARSQPMVLGKRERETAGVEEE